MTITMLLQPVMEVKPDDVPASVWHYTDAAGAAGIISNREVWATDGLFLNDATELQLVHRDFETVLKSGAGSGDLRPGELEHLVTAYQAAVTSYGTRDFFKVIYDRDEQIDAVAGFCATALGHLDRFLGECGSDDREPALKKAGETLALMAQWFSARVKHASFREEQEWRFIYRQPTTPDEPAPYAREFRTTSTGLVPYVRLALGDGENEGFPLIGVRVGPTARTELAGRALNYLLKDHGFDLRPEQSAIPLRP